jgi:hypothetical protein
MRAPEHRDHDVVMPEETSFGTRYNPPAKTAWDRFVRRFGPLMHVAAILALYAVFAAAIGLALAPALWFMHAWTPMAANHIGPLHWPLQGLGYGIAFFIAGFGLLLIVSLFNFLLPTRTKPFIGGYYSSAAIPWALHNGLFYLARYTFLPFVTLTPFGMWFLRAMGMRIGARAHINTEFISDPSLIEIGDDAVIGGSVHLFAHFGGGGHLTIAPVRIGHRATIGQMATLMGDVWVGDDAVILPHTVLLPGTRVGQGEIWGGVPGRRMSHAEIDAARNGGNAEP